MLTKIASLLVLTLLPFLGMAQSSEAADITFSVSPRENVKVGDKVTFQVEVTPKSKWHVYSAIPSDDDAYIPSEVTFDLTSRNFETVAETEEQGSMHSEYDDIMGGTLRYYKGKVIFTKELTVSDPELVIAGTFDYMACNEFKCIPLMAEFSLEVNLK